MVRQAVIDVGTNSVKFHVGEMQADGTWKTVVDRADVSRLGEGIQDTGSISPAAMERTAHAIADMTIEAARLAVDGITIVGTMALRTATNSRAFQDLIKDRTGTAIEVVSGEQECRLAYLAARSAARVGDGTLVVFDTGGGSSQFTLGDGTRVDRQFSVNVGAVRFTDQFHLDRAASPEVLREAISAIAADLSALDRVDPPSTLIGMGGAVTNIAAVKLALPKYEPEKVQGLTLAREEIDRQIELYRTSSADDRRKIVGLQPKRAEVILAGACIVQAVMEKLKARALAVSDRGLRHGILIDRFGGRLA